MNKDFEMLENLNGLIDLDIKNLSSCIDLFNSQYNDKELLKVQLEQIQSYLLLIYNDLYNNYKEAQDYIKNKYTKNEDKEKATI